MDFPTVQQYRDDLEPMVSGGSLSGARVYRVLHLAFAELNRHVYANSLRREVDPLSPYFPTLDEYSVPKDVDEVISIAKGTEFYEYTTLTDLQRERYGNRYDVRYRNGVKVLYLDEYEATLPEDITLMNGTNNATNVSVGTLEAEKENIRNTNNVSGIKISLLSANTSGTFSVNGGTTTPNNQNDNSSVFVRCYIPDKTYIDSVAMTIGNGVTNQTITTTKNQASNSFENGWNLLRFDLDKNQDSIVSNVFSNMSITVNYNSVGATLTGDITGIIFDDLFIHNGEDLKLLYQSNAPFFSSTGGFLSTPTSDSDTIYLEPDAYNILLIEGGRILSQRVQAEDGSFNERYFKGKLFGDGQDRGMYDTYRDKHPDEVPDRTTMVYQNVKLKYRTRPSRNIRTIYTR